MAKDHTNYNGLILNVTDEQTGLNLPACFLTVESFALYSNSLNFSYGDWINTDAFDADKVALGLFRKPYSVIEQEFQDFKSANAQILAAFFAVARALCDAPETAEFKFAVINPINYKIRFQFYEVGQYFTFYQDADAYLSTVENESFAQLRAAMAQICKEIAQAKNREFWGVDGD